jgi:hypothetical protein
MPPQKILNPTLDKMKSFSCLLCKQIMDIIITHIPVCVSKVLFYYVHVFINCQIGYRYLVA